MKPNAVAFVSDTNPETVPLAMKACLKADAKRRSWILSVNTPNLFTLIRQNLLQYKPEVIAIDANLRTGDLARLGELAQMTPPELNRLTSDPEANLPASLRLLRFLAREKSPTTPVFYFTDELPIYLNLIVYSLGATWVWTPRSNVDGSEEDFTYFADTLIRGRGGAGESV